MKVLLAEYTVAHEPALAHEGAAMLAVLKSSFERCGHDVVLPGPGDFGEEITRLASQCDMGLVIAPDHLISKYTFLLEQATHNLGCGFMAAAVCANKVSSGKVLSDNDVPVPGTTATGKRVIKPIRGCGSQGVRLSGDSPRKDEFTQEYIEGENYSVSIVINRVIGDACAYYSGKPPVVLAVNRQEIALGPDGTFQYLGGETPVHPDREKEIIDTAVKAATILGCQGYCGVDVVLADKIWVVDVNPRITTSIVGIAACMEEEIAEILISASKGDGPATVHFSGRARFDCNGKVTRV